MKQSEFVRWLRDQGATFKEGTNHMKVYLNDKQTILPRHPSKELKKGLVEGVKKTTEPQMKRRLKSGLVSQRAGKR